MSERTVEVMKWRRRIRGFLSYGSGRTAGKALVVCLAICVALAGPAKAAEDADEVTVLAFGDSLTQGYGLVQDQGFVPQLRAWLAERGVAAGIVNGGVSGETTAGGAARIDWSLTPGIDAMILELGANDMLRGIDPAVTRANLALILEAAAARDVPVLLVRVPASGNFGADYKAAFDAIYSDLAAAYGTLFYPDFLAGLDADSPDQARRFMQPDGIHPNAAGVARIVEAIGPAVMRLIEAAQSARP